MPWAGHVKVPQAALARSVVSKITPECSVNKAKLGCWVFLAHPKRQAWRAVVQSKDSRAVLLLLECKDNVASKTWRVVPMVRVHGAALV